MNALWYSIGKCANFNKIVFQTHNYIAISALLFEYWINRLCVESNILDDDIFIILPMKLSFRK